MVEVYAAMVEVWSKFHVGLVEVWSKFILLWSKYGRSSCCFGRSMVKVVIQCIHKLTMTYDTQCSVGLYCFGRSMVEVYVALVEVWSKFMLLWSKYGRSIYTVYS